MTMLEKAQELYMPLQYVQSISVEDFESQFALAQVPLVIGGMAEDWPARNRWLLNALKDSYGHHLVKVFRSSDESEVTMRLTDYIAYMQQTEEDHPYYLKNWVFADDFPDMRADYKVLPHFNNWLDSLPAELNPKFRWIFIGPRNSYSHLHLDVFLTNAWNVLIEGCKLWLFFPPNGGMNFHNLQFDPLFPGYHFPNMDGLKGYYAIQRPGEIVFTPGNWYHQVYNLENSVALTENYINHTNCSIVEDYLFQTENEQVLSLLTNLKERFL
jgi:histone arginine demethylase JMJD6